LNVESIPGAVKMLIGLLLNSRLLSKQLVLFTDGVRDIHAWIVKLFAFANFKIMMLAVEPLRRNPSPCAVPSTAVVEAVDVFKHSQARVMPCGICFQM
jgi:hypothetical protein